MESLTDPILGNERTFRSYVAELKRYNDCLEAECYGMLDTKQTRLRLAKQLACVISVLPDLMPRADAEAFIVGLIKKHEQRITEVKDAIDFGLAGESLRVGELVKKHEFIIERLNMGEAQTEARLRAMESVLAKFCQDVELLKIHAEKNQGTKAGHGPPGLAAELRS